MLLKAPRTPTRAEVQEHEELGQCSTVIGAASAL